MITFVKLHIYHTTRGKTLPSLCLLSNEHERDAIFSNTRNILNHCSGFKTVRVGTFVSCCTCKYLFFRQYAVFNV